MSPEQIGTLLAIGKILIVQGFVIILLLCTLLGSLVKDRGSDRE